ncbi:putative DNA binding domain-containing protein [Bifidobacterium thermacidophilum]|uniref:DNA binding domain-containing protein n=1 Tax=Bifidobacterium thermacidophilum TaxID=246618 RepID=A0ABW8KQ60_9BIFI
MFSRESETVEFKKTTSQLKEGIISLCAMLNKHGRGIVYFGVKDDGSIVGQDVGKKTTADISHEIRTNLKPLPEINIEIHNVNDKAVIAVQAEGMDTPYSAYGRYYTRVDDADTYMDSNQLLRFFESKDTTYSKWEEQPSGFSIDTVNEDLLIQYIRAANDAGRMHYIFNNASEALNKLNLITDDGQLNNAGHYLFGNDGPVLLKEVMYPTDDRREFADLKQYRGNILECIQEGMRYIENNIRYSARIDGLHRTEMPEIPIRAIREIIVNSFAHCRYQKGDSNAITITRSRVTIYNPGGLLHGTEPRDFASGRIGSKIRNPLIASVLFKNGMIDAFGTGFDRTFKECAENGVEYSYRNDEFGFTFTFTRKHVEANRTIPSDSKSLANDTDKIIMDLISKDQYITTTELAKTLGVSRPTIARHIKSLTEHGVLERVGSRKSGYWAIRH